jgi:hypothetical protein
MNDQIKLGSTVMDRLSVLFARSIYAMELDRPVAFPILSITVAEFFGFFSFLGIATLLSGLLA